MKNKLIFAIVIILLVSAPLFGGNITVTGYGKDAEAAKADAYDRLIEQIYGVTVNKSATSILSQSGGKDNSTFYSGSFQSSSGILFGLTYSQAEKTSGSEKKYGKYKVIAEIKDSSQLRNQILNDMAKEKKTITSLYETYSYALDLEMRKSSIISLMASELAFEQLTTFAITLGIDQRDIPETGISETYQSLATKYMSILAEEESSITKEIENNSSGVIATQLRAQLQENQKEQEKAKEQETADIKRVQEIALRQAEARVQQIVDANKTVDYDTRGNDVESAVNMVRRIINLESTFLNLVDKYDAMAEEERVRLVGEYEIEKKAIENKTYRIAELSDGKPTKVALQHRADEIKALKTRKDSEFNQTISIIRDTFYPSLSQYYDDYLNNKKELEKTVYSASAKHGEIAINSIRYDGNRYCWIVSFRFKELGQNYNVELKYSQVTGQSVNLSEYEEYNSTVEYYDKILKESFVKMFDLELDFKLSFGGQTFRYDISDVYLVSSGNRVRIDMISGSTTGPFAKADYQMSVPSWLSSMIAKQKVKAFVSKHYAVVGVSAGVGPGEKIQDRYNGLIVSLSAKASVVLWRHYLVGVRYNLDYQKSGTVTIMKGNLLFDVGAGAEVGPFSYLGGGVLLGNLNKNISLSAYIATDFRLGTGCLSANIVMDLNKDKLMSPKLYLGYSLMFQK